MKDFTYEECRKLDVGAYKGEQFTGQQMVDLDEMIAALQEDPQRLIFFDVKQIDFEILAKATESVHPQIILASPSYDQLKTWKKFAPRSKAMLCHSSCQIVSESISRPSISKIAPRIRSPPFVLPPL